MMPTAVQVSGLRSFPSTFLRRWKMKETNRRGNWWRNEAGQPENACLGVIETLPVGVIPYREAYLSNAGTVAIFDVWSLYVRM